MFFENGKAVNQAAKTAAKFMAEKGVKLAHHDALELVARLQGFPNHAAATARLEGTRKGTPQTLKSWADLFQVIACMNNAERARSITLSQGCDENGNAEFFESKLILKATDSSIGAAAHMLESNDHVLMFSVPQPEASTEDPDEAETNKLAHRIAMQAELVSGEGGIYAEVYAAVRRNSLLAIQRYNKQWDVSLMDGPWVVWSETEQGYWHWNFGWVGDRDSATGFPDEEDANEAARFAGGNGKARLIP